MCKNYRHYVRSLRDRSIFMGIRDRKICNGTTGYFGPLVERGHGLFWGLALRGHGLYQYRISTGPKIILNSSAVRGHGPFLLFSGLFHIKDTGPEQIYTTGLTFILEGDFKGAVENFWPSFEFMRYLKIPMLWKMCDVIFLLWESGGDEGRTRHVCKLSHTKLNLRRPLHWN